MKILVLGAGRMGLGAAFDLVHNSPGVEAVTVADFDLNKANDVAAKVGTSKIEAKHVDASNYDDIVALMRGHDSGDLVRELLVQRIPFKSSDRDRHKLL
jgi:lysine 6-dehydrogenase